MDQWLSVLVAFIEDLGLLPRTTWWLTTINL